MAPRSHKPVRRPTRRRQSSSFPSYLLAAVAVLAIGAAFYFMNKTSVETQVDKTTLCPTSGPVAMTAVLFDLTDPLSLAQANQLRSYLEQEIEQAPVGTQFTLGVVADTPEAWGASPALCKPRSKDDVSALTQNVTLVQKRYEEGFLAPLQLRMEQMIQTNTAETSPIMEALQGLVAASDGFLTFEGPRQVIVVSDLLQNSDAMSFYRGEDWSVFAGSAAYERMGQSLEAAEITLYQVPRPLDQIAEPAAVEDFWAHYFDLQGANLPHLKRLGDL